MVKLAFTAVFIINQIKYRRLIIGLTARNLALALGMSDAYISAIESVTATSQYPPNELIKIAKILKCNVTDFYPPHETLLKHDGEHVFKEIISLSKVEDVTTILSGLIDHDYFKSGVAYKELCKYLHVLIPDERETVSKALNLLVENNVLKFIDGMYMAKSASFF